MDTYEHISELSLTGEHKLKFLEYKRKYCYRDEWAIYIMITIFFVGWWLQYLPLFSVIFVSSYGTCAIVTSYLNIDHIQKKFFDYEDRWIFWPLCHNKL
jgi:hypothetical protein